VSGRLLSPQAQKVRDWLLANFPDMRRSGQLPPGAAAELARKMTRAGWTAAAATEALKSFTEEHQRKAASEKLRNGEDRRLTTGELPDDAA
jgi:hypothetical protein